MTEPDDPRVRTRTGVVRGRWRQGAAVFLGIPYAAAPVGRRRFGAPEPAAAWSGERDASRPGATPQRHPLAPVTTIPEPSIPGDDILNLNVFTPCPGAPDRRLPVLVWIHGGGFMGGSPASPWYDGTTFGRDGVVTVVISYRLGFDGFGWIADAPHNRGLLDQLAALRWVRENIADFGGDPDAVTIAGQSAGGTSVLTLLTMPAAQGLFRGAICQSGAERTQRLDDAERLGRLMADAVGVRPIRTDWSTVSETKMRGAQAPFGMVAPPERVDPVTFARANLYPGTATMTFGPVIDGELLPRPVEQALAAGWGADTPLLIGANAHEFTRVLGAAAASLAGVDTIDVLAAAGLSAAAAADVVAGQPELRTPDQQLGQLTTERMFRLPLLDWVRRRAEGGADDRTWLYDFRWAPTGSPLVQHCTELPFVWDLLTADGVRRVLGPNPPQSLADRMHTAWTRFVRTGEPGWPPPAHVGTDLTGMVFGDTCAVAPLLTVEQRIAAGLTGKRDTPV